MNYCPKCGNELEEGAVFCGRCGAKTGVDHKKSGVAGGLGVVALVLSIFGFLTGIFGIGLVLDVIAIALAVFSIKLAGKGGGHGRAIASITVAGLSLVLCAGIYVAGNKLDGLLSGDVSLTDDTIPYGSEDFQSEVLRNVRSEYTCKISDTNIDPNTIGSYYVELVYSKDGKEKTKRFDVKVADKTPPEHEIGNRCSDGNTVYAYVNDEASLLEAITLIDDCDGEQPATAENTKIEDVIFSVPDTYHASVTLRDRAGNEDAFVMDVRVTEPEITLRDYIEHYLTAENFEVHTNLGSIELWRLDDPDDILGDGETLDLTAKKLNLHFVKYASGSREDGARFSSNTTFDQEFKVIEESWNSLLMRESWDSATVAARNKEWLTQKAQPGSSVYLGTFSAFEDDPVVRQLGGFSFFLGKTPEDLESITVNLKTRSAVQ